MSRHSCLTATCSCSTGLFVGLPRLIRFEAIGVLYIPHTWTSHGGPNCLLRETSCMRAVLNLWHLYATHELCTLHIHQSDSVLEEPRNQGLFAGSCWQRPHIHAIFKESSDQ